MREPLLVLDAQLRIKKANHAFHEFFKTPREKDRGVFSLNSANGQWNIPALQKVLRSDTPKKNRAARLRSVPVIRKGIPTGPWSSMPGDCPRSEQDEELILLAIEDVTEHAAALYAITDRRKDEFLAMLAHELRNPLAPIRNALAVLRMDSANRAGAGSTTLSNASFRIWCQAGGQSIDAGRITRGDIVLKKEPVDWRRCQPGGRSHPPTAGRTASACVIAAQHFDNRWSRPHRLKQIVTNLLSNAIKYTETGGRIGITIERRDDEAVLSVTDSGIGMDRETSSHVYDLFLPVQYLVQPQPGRPGIGLTLVKRLVDLHRGPRGSK